MRFTSNSRGISLIGVMAAATVAAILALGMGQMIAGVSRSVRGASDKTNKNSIATLVDTVLGNPEACKKSLAGINFATNTQQNFSIKNSAGADVIAANTQRDGWFIGSVTVSPGPVPPDGIYLATAKVEMWQVKDDLAKAPVNGFSRLLANGKVGGDFTKYLNLVVSGGVLVDCLATSAQRTQLASVDEFDIDVSSSASTLALFKPPTIGPIADVEFLNENTHTSKVMLAGSRTVRAVGNTWEISAWAKVKSSASTCNVVDTIITEVTPSSPPVTFPVANIGIGCMNDSSSVSSTHLRSGFIAGRDYRVQVRMSKTGAGGAGSWIMTQAAGILLKQYTRGGP